MTARQVLQLLVGRGFRTASRSGASGPSAAAWSKRSSKISLLLPLFAHSLENLRQRDDGSSQGVGRRSRFLLGLVLFLGFFQNLGRAFGSPDGASEDWRATDVPDLEGCIGAVRNIDGRRWVALRRCGNNSNYLDSLQRQAGYPREAELSDLLRTHPNYVIRNI